MSVVERQLFLYYLHLIQLILVQVALMAPTEILARQHYLLAKKLFNKYVRIEIISGKSTYKDKKIF